MTTKRENEAIICSNTTRPMQKMLLFTRKNYIIELKKTILYYCFLNASIAQTHFYQILELSYFQCQV